MERHLLTTVIASLYIDEVYHEEPLNLYRGMQRLDEGTSSSNNLFDEGTSSNPFFEENKILRMLHDLQEGIEHVEEMKEGLENEMSFISGVDLEEDKTNVVFKKLLNQARFNHKITW